MCINVWTEDFGAEIETNLNRLNKTTLFLTQLHTFASSHSQLVWAGTWLIFLDTYNNYTRHTLIRKWQRWIIIKKKTALSCSNGICLCSVLIQTLEVVYTWHMQAGENDNFSGYLTQTVFANMSWHLFEPVWSTRWLDFITSGWS